MTPAISIVIPIMNEEESLRDLHAQVAGAAERLPETWELILVDDGSTDGTGEVLAAIRAQDPRVRAIRLKRNFGQTAAMACGIDAARGEVIITMDGDLQNDPADIPRLLAKLDEGYDVVSGWRYRRQDKLWTRKIPSMVANRLIGFVTGVRLHDYGCCLKAFRAASIKRIPLYAEFHRFIPALSTLTGALIAELKVNHRARQHGRTKYNLSRTWRVALDMFTVSLLIKFASKPLRLFGILALAAAAAAWISLMGAFRVQPGASGEMFQVLPGIAMLGMGLSGHLLVIGWIAELCLRTAHASPERLIAAGAE